MESRPDLCAHTRLEISGTFNLAHCDSFITSLPHKNSCMDQIKKNHRCVMFGCTEKRLCVRENKGCLVLGTECWESWTSRTLSVMRPIIWQSGLFCFVRQTHLVKIYIFWGGGESVSPLKSHMCSFQKHSVPCSSHALNIFFCFPL